MEVATQVAWKNRIEEALGAVKGTEKLVLADFTAAPA